jgi:hypothetical protein
MRSDFDETDLYFVDRDFESDNGLEDESENYFVDRDFSCENENEDNLVDTSEDENELEDEKEGCIFFHILLWCV